MSITPIPKVKYLTNKDLLAAIHESKCTYCEFDDKKYARYDVIVSSLESVTPDMLEAARMKRLSDALMEAKKDKKATPPSLTLDDFPLNEIVVRLMTFEHIPLNPAKFDKAKTVAERHIRCPFPPFQHFIWENDTWRCVGKSHQKNGAFSITHGRTTNRLGAMWIKLVDRYGHRGNWRGYCVDEQTEALTQRGWLGMDEITSDDQVLSCDKGVLTWSKITDIYRGEYHGLMHKITTRGLDCLVTPGHKKVTQRGLVPVEMLLESDHMLLMGAPESGAAVATYSDAFVELVAWIVTEGSYDWGGNGEIKNITIYQNENKHAARIRSCLNQLGYQYGERMNDTGNVGFRIWKTHCEEIVKVIPEKNLNMEFLLSLTRSQREMFLETLIDGDGWRTQGRKRYGQKDAHHVALFQALCVLLGQRSRAHLNHHVSFGKPTSSYNVNVFTDRKNQVKVEHLNFHGGKQNNRAHIGKGKHLHPNTPTQPYTGRVWCVSTEYGSFVAKRSHTVFLTGNSYLEEMKAQALLQLSQVGLQFDESKSLNPFSYYTSCVSTSFLKILTTEKKSQSIRDDLLIMHNHMPSHTRQTADALNQRMQLEGPTETDAARLLALPTGA